MNDILGRFGKAFAAEVAKELAKELRSANDDGWVSQDKSSMPARVHCAAVRRRVESGLPDAMIDVKLKRFLMTKDAMLEEMRARGQKRPLAKTAARSASEPESGPPTGVRERIMKKLGRS